MERDAAKRLAGRIEIDDADLGGERHGGKRGRGSPGKTPIVAAVETTLEGKPIRLKLRRVKGFRRTDIVSLAKRNFDPDSTVVSDGLRCFRAVLEAGCTHLFVSTGGGALWFPVHGIAATFFDEVRRRLNQDAIKALGFLRLQCKPARSNGTLRNLRISRHRRNGRGRRSKGNNGLPGLTIYEAIEGLSGNT